MSEESKIEAQRGPRFPRYTLAEAVTKTARLSEGIKRAKVALGTAVEALGYKSINGAALTTMATLNQYGLIDRAKNVVSVSPLALKILHPVSEQQKLEALREAAMRPTKFAEIFTSLRDCGESVIRSHLIQDDFTPETAGLAASIYKENLEFANIKEGDIIRQEEDQSESNMANNETKEAQNKNDQARVAAHVAALMAGHGATTTKELSFPLPDGMAQLKVPFPLSEEGFSTLLQTLAVFKSGMVKTEVLAVDTSQGDWQEQAEALAGAGIPFNLIGFSYAHDIKFYNEIAKKYDLESRFDPVKGVAYFKPKAKGA